MEKKILLIEQNFFLGRAIKYRIDRYLNYQVIWYKTSNEYIEKGIDLSKIDLGIINCTYNKEVINLLDNLKLNNIPIILIAEEYNNKLEKIIKSYKIIDYILKGHNYSADYIFDITKRFFTNKIHGILTITQNNAIRENVYDLLERHRYKTFFTDNQNDLFEIFKKNSECIKIVIISHNPPEFDAFDTISNIRKLYPIDKVSIIGISEKDNKILNIHYIKSGANDYIELPFINEIFYCRIEQSIKVIENFNQIRDLAVKDQLTRLNNRHYLKEAGELLFQSTLRHNLALVSAMIDIDDFKKINDTFGHDAGDIVLKEISMILKNYIRKSDILVRYGGEEFLILGNNLDPDYAQTFFNKLRLLIATKKIDLGERNISITVSIGICTNRMESLEQMINDADKKLYIAKKTGKNKVVSE